MGIRVALNKPVVLVKDQKTTALPFDTSGIVEVEGALNPVHVSHENDYAVYVEPNVWIVHSTG